jgi:ubiquinone/menaquinone biosynthesis C-methylase UbiE
MRNFTNYWEKSRIMARACLAYKPASVLDVGCGEGKLVKLLRDEGVDARGIDIGECGKYCPKYCSYGNASDIPFDDSSFDIVVSDGVLEHIPEEDIDKVYSEMKRVGKHIILRICVKTKPWPGHITIKPISWWKKKMVGCQFIGKEWNR